MLASLGAIINCYGFPVTPKTVNALALCDGKVAQKKTLLTLFAIVRYGLVDIGDAAKEATARTADLDADGTVCH